MRVLLLPVSETETRRRRFFLLEGLKLGFPKVDKDFPKDLEKFINFIFFIVSLRKVGPYLLLFVTICKKKNGENERNNKTLAPPQPKDQVRL